MKCAPILRRVAMGESRAVCSSGAARWRIGREKKRRVTGPLGRSVAESESPGDPRPEEETEVIVVYRWVLAVCPMVVKLGRQLAVARLGFLSMACFRQGKTNRHTECVPA
jgi:hypothetical protein